MSCAKMLFMQSSTDALKALLYAITGENNSIFILNML